MFPPHLRSEVLAFTRTTPEGDLRQRAEHAANRALGRYGIVRRCRRHAAIAGLPDLPVYVARGPRRGPDGWAPAFDLVGMGVAEDDGDARLAAVVEAVERYCFSRPHDPTTVVRASARGVGDDAIPSARFAPFSPEQYSSSPLINLPSPDDPVDWTWAYSLTRRSFALVPATVAFATFDHRAPNDLTRWVMSTGVACHVSVEAALLSGLLEVVERDAVMIHWLNGRPPPRVVLGGGEASRALAALLDRHFRVPDFRFELFDLTLDGGIPVVACLARSDRPDRPAAAMGAACRPDPIDAARKALFEAAQLLHGLDGLGWCASSSFPAADVRTLWDHARFYAGAAGAEQLTTFASSTREVSLDDLTPVPVGSTAEALDECVRRLAPLEVVAVDLTTADAAACGFRTLRVLVPGAVDINGDVRFPPLGHDRLRSVPAALGWPPCGDVVTLAPCPLT